VRDRGTLPLIGPIRPYGVHPHADVSVAKKALYEFSTASAPTARDHFKRDGKGFEFESRVLAEMGGCPPLCCPAIHVDRIVVDPEDAGSWVGSKECAEGSMTHSGALK